jgi:transposase InsO family protein
MARRAIKEAMMTDKEQRSALFWCTLLNPIIFGELSRKERSAHLKKISRTDVAFLDGTVRKPSRKTLKRKLRIYETEGLEGFARKPRRDRGKVRAHPQEIIDKAVQLKKEGPHRSPYIINKFLKVKFGRTIPESSLHRYLAQAGATKLKLGATKKPIRCRWTREHTHDLWVGDCEDGPYVLLEGQLVPTSLVAFIDCHSRYAVVACYYLRETFDCLIDALLKAWDIHGASGQLYLDNAKIFITPKLQSACLQVHTEILHRPVGDPPPGGLIERLFLTLQGQFESEIRAGQPLGLSELNRALQAWLEVCYHSREHSETKQTPEERYHQGLKAIRRVDLACVIPFFMEEHIRTVHKDFSDVQVHSFFYKVDPKLRGDKLLVRFDPYGDKQSVLLYSLTGQYLGKALRHDREKAPQLPQKSSPVTPKDSFIELIVTEHDKVLQAKAKQPSFPKLPSGLSFQDLAKTVAHLLGLQGGLTAFSLNQLEHIQKTYEACPDLNKALVKRAFETAPQPSLLSVLYALKTLAKQKES